MGEAFAFARWIDLSFPWMVESPRRRSWYRFALDSWEAGERPR